MDLNSTKLSHKRWKALLKKEKRKLKRQTLAKCLENGYIENAESTENTESNTESDSLIDEEQKRQQHIQWLEREKEAQDLFKAKKDKEERERIQKENEKLIREQYEREKELLLIEDKLVSTEVPEKRTSPKVWHNPEPPKGFIPEDDVPNVCTFFQKVGACRFGMSCSRNHPVPSSSSTIMIPGMFFCFGMEHAIHDVLDSDVNLEYDDQDTYEEFQKFHDETYPEFQKAGTVTNYFVCCNYEPHLKGNVYVEYSRKSEAKKAFQIFNGRWFDKRQLSCQFVKLKSWTSAICGSFLKNKCPKGKHCNFLHVFQHPKKMENTNQTRQKSGFSRHRSPHASDARFYRDRTWRSSSRSSHNRNQGKHSRRSRSRSRSPRSECRSSLKRSPHGSTHRSMSKSSSNSLRLRMSSRRSSSRSRSRNRFSPKSSRSVKRNSEQRRSTSAEEMSEDLAEVKRLRKHKKKKKLKKERKESKIKCKASSKTSPTGEYNLSDIRTSIENCVENTS